MLLADNDCTGYFFYAEWNVFLIMWQPIDIPNGHRMFLTTGSESVYFLQYTQKL